MKEYRVNVYSLVDPNENGEQELSFELSREFSNENDARYYFKSLIAGLPAHRYYVEIIDPNGLMFAWYGVDPDELNQE